MVTMPRVMKGSAGMSFVSWSWIEGDSVRVMAVAAQEAMEKVREERRE